MLLKTGGQYCRRLVFNQAIIPLLFTREIPLAARRMPLSRQGREYAFVMYRSVVRPDYAGARREPSPFFQVRLARGQLL